MNKNIDLSVEIGNVKLRNPFIVGSGPTAKNLDQLKKAEESGWAAASLKLAIDPAPYISLPPRYRWSKKNKLHMFTAETRLTEAASLKLLEDGRNHLSELVLIPNITYDGSDMEGWASMASRYENAGAKIIELNMCCPNMSYNQTVTGTETVKATGASLGSDLGRLSEVVKAVVGSVHVPIIVKLTPEGGCIADAAQICIDAGAAAVGGTGNRLGIADLDIFNPEQSIYRLQENNTLSCLSGPWLRPLALRDTYEIRHLLGGEPFVIGSGGVSDMESTIRQIMAGADAVWVCTETIVRGFNWLPKTLDKIEGYMMEMGFSGIRDFRDSIHHNIKPASGLKINYGYAVVDEKTCISCGNCWELGHCIAISHNDAITRIDPNICLGCSTCVDVCPKDAIEMVQNAYISS